VADHRSLKATQLALLCVFVLGAACTSERSNTAASTKHSATTTKNAVTGQGTDKKQDAGTVTTKIDRSGVSDVGTDGPLDYADPRMWLCRPGNDPDECDANLDATELLPDGTQQLVKHVKAENPTFDCFYVYPTVKLTSAGPMTDFANIDITLDPLLAQAARFNRVCRMYAPLYRQNGVVPGAGGAPTAGGSFNLGAGDVRDAFKYYLDHLSQGRKFVLMGHSQGTGMVTAMMVQDVDPNPEVRAKLISALLLGGSVTVPDGQDVGGTFQNIPICTKPRQVGCAMTYASFSKEVPPSATGGFGSSAQTGLVAACTEPAALADRASERYSGSYVALNLVNKTFLAQGIDQLPSVDTSYILYRDVFRGECKSGNGRNYLEISLEMAADDPRPPFPYHFPGLESALGLHLVDYALELDDLIEDVRLQAEAAGD
jgi:pimeloyl-ACP methyl ester carboxylesterase